MRIRSLARGIGLILSLAVIAVVVRESGLADGLEDVQSWIDIHVRGQGLAGEAVFVAIAAAGTAVGLPRHAFAIAGGYAFGVALGAALTVMACTIGCLCAFSYARWLGRDLVAERYPRRIKKIDAFLSDNPFLTTLAVRLMPVGSNVATNLLAGVSSVAAAPFLIGSALGYTPQTLVFVLVGSGIEQSTAARTAIAIALFVASASIGVFLYRRNRRARGFDEALDEVLDEPAERSDTNPRPNPDRS